MNSKLSKWSVGSVVTAGVVGLALVVALGFLLPHMRALAQGAPSAVTSNVGATTEVLTPTSQTLSPEKGALITEKGMLTIEGVAWLGDNRPPFPGDPTLLPIEKIDEADYYVIWTEAELGDDYALYEAEDPYFEDQTRVYSGPLTQTLILDQPDGTYYYRVRASNPNGWSRWSNVESVTVGSGGESMAAQTLDVSAEQPITVEVRVGDDAQWHTALITGTDWGGWEWWYEWDVPEGQRYTDYAIQTRAIANGIEGPIDTITVTVNNEIYMVYLPLLYRYWPPVPYSPTLAEINNPEHRVSYTLNWSYDGTPAVPGPDSYTIEEATDPAFTAPTVYTTTATQLSITDPEKEKEGGTYYYRVRGHNEYGPGFWSEIRSTLVRVLPYAPTLHDIEIAEGEDSYTVEWSYEYDYPPVDDGFVLEEATEPGFSDPVIFTVDADTTSHDFTDKGAETYYYRVKGRNAYGDGPWSEVKSVVSTSDDFYDDFTDPTSGWLTHEAKWGLVGCDRGDLQQNPEYKYSLFYEDGRYHVNIPLDCRAGGRHGDTRHIYPVVSPPNVERPTTKACVQVQAVFEEWDPWWSFYGLVFAASEDKSTVYSLEVNNLGDWAVLKRTGYDFPGPNHPWENETRHELIKYIGGQRWPAVPAFEPNTLRAEVNGNDVKLFINGRLVHQFSDPEISALTQVGIIGGSWEITPTQIGYNYFYLDEGCDDF